MRWKEAINKAALNFIKGFYIGRLFMDVSSWDGTLSLNDFSISARAFAEKWKRNNSASPPWSWVTCPNRPLVAASQHVEAYLSLENICLVSSTQDNNDDGIDVGEDVSSFVDKEGTTDNATLVQSNDCEVHYYDFHVVYSASYRVPVLYFRAHYSDGLPLPLNEIEKDLPACSSKVLLQSKWTFITQEEHPYLNRPWYKLHPCGTSEWMKLLFLGYPAVPLAEKGVAIELYVLSWFSVVGQVVGLRTPLEMVKNDSVTGDCTLT